MSNQPPLFTIDAIEGNSNIGVPVYSRFGQMQNYNFIALSPVKQTLEREPDAPPLLERENQKFKIA